MDKNFYVYERFRKDNNTCFYVGMGHGDRCFKKHRNKLHDEIYDKYGCVTKIYKNNLTKEEASVLEKERISYYVNELNYGINIGENLNKETDRFLTNGSWGGEDGCFKEGKNNQQYRVSPKERMGNNYNTWLQKTRSRLLNQVGDKNPNYNNKTLHNKIKDDPELRKKYYSRPGKQNGRATSIQLFDSNKNYLKTFFTIGDCAEYIINITNSKSNLDGVRGNISKAESKNEPYKGFYFKKIN